MIIQSNTPMEINNTQKVNVLAYFLTYVGFMTLTLSMSMIPILAEHINVSHTTTQIAMSISFFMFSLSAIVFATLSYIFTAKKVLVVSQSISIIGIITLSATQDIYSMYLGFVLVGLGTGCYSSISRAIISRNATSNTQMKKSYAMLSCCIILAPVISAYLALGMIPISWRLAYVCMALIEISLMVYSLPILTIDALKHKLTLKKHIFSGFKNALSQPKYVLNVINTAVMFSFYLGVLMSSFKGLIVDELNLTLRNFAILFLASSLIYILGIISYRYKAHVAYKKRYHIGILVIIFFAVVYYTLVGPNVFHIVPLIYLICYLIGFLVALATGIAMSNIKSGHGSAAAMITFLVALCMSIWEYLKAHLHLSNYDFILLALWTTLFIVVSMKIIAVIIDKKTSNLNKI